MGSRHMAYNAHLIKTATEHMKNLKIGEYIIQSLVDKNINVGFGYKIGPHSPIYDYAKNHDNFDIVFEEYEQNSTHKAITYSSVNNFGVIFSTSSTGFDNIMMPIRLRHKVPYPLLLLSFFDPATELKHSPFIGNTKSLLKESKNINIADNFQDVMEDTLSYAQIFPPGHVHLNISNNILNDPIDLTVKKLLKEPKKVNKDCSDDENLSELQYFEQRYEMLNKQDTGKNYLMPKCLGSGAESHSSIPFTKPTSNSGCTQSDTVGDVTRAMAIAGHALQASFLRFRELRPTPTDSDFLHVERGPAVPSCRNCLICGIDTEMTARHYGKMKLYKCKECGWLT